MPAIECQEIIVEMAPVDAGLGRVLGGFVVWAVGQLVPALNMPGDGLGGGE